MKYWLELPLVVGLSGRFLSDVVAAGAMAGVMKGDRWPEFDPSKTTATGAKIQREPLVYNASFPNAAYYLYSVMLFYWAYVFGSTLFDTIAQPGQVFGALGVPPAVMQIVAYGNVLIMVYYAGSYLADGIKGSIQARRT